MFENIIGQDAVVGTLRQELAAGSLPSSLLLHGPTYSGKMSAALEIARELTCSRQADWSCPCASCRKQRLLIHPSTLLCGSRYFELEIAAAADVLRRVRTPPAQYLFIRAVRKLTRRFDPLLWEGEESRIRHLEPALGRVEESLDAFSPDREAGGELAEDALEKRLEDTIVSCRQLARGLPADNIPIHVVRRACAWLHLSSPEASARKILILENADRMVEASANSLLKLLEEPPPQATIILTTARRAAMIPTVLSRLRPYAFVGRTRQESAEVLARIFREESGKYSSLRDYFLYWQEVNPDELRLLAQRFVQSVLAGRSSGEEPQAEGIPEQIGRLFAGKAAREAAGVFFEELLQRFGLLLREGIVDPTVLGRWNSSLRRHLEACERFNQSPVLSLESLYYSLRGIQ